MGHDLPGLAAFEDEATEAAADALTPEAVGTAEAADPQVPDARAVEGLTVDGAVAEALPTADTGRSA